MTTTALVAAMLQLAHQKPGGHHERRYQRLAPIFIAEAENAGIEVTLLVAVAYVESSFRVKAKSSCGALGLMGLLPGGAIGIGMANRESWVMKPQVNIAAGARYLCELMFRYGPQASLSKYNGRKPRRSRYSVSVLIAKRVLDEAVARE